MTSENSKGNKGFFAVDAHQWERVCNLGLPPPSNLGVNPASAYLNLGMNPAVAYLVLARFSGPDNITTSASCNAVEKHANISRSNAKEAVDALCTNKVIEKVKDGTRPRYKIQSSQASQPDERISKGTSPARRRREAQLAKVLGKVQESEPKVEPKKESLTNAANKVIWLPNSIVDGVVGKPSPLQLLRQGQDVMTLRLFVELYSGQNLIEDMGVSRRIVHQIYERKLLAEVAEWNIWGFGGAKTWCYNDHHVTNAHCVETLDNAGAKKRLPLFSRVATLKSLGLIDWIPVVFESEQLTSEPMFEIGNPADEFSVIVYSAAEALLAKKVTDGGIDKQVDGYDFVVPIHKHVGQVQIFGVCRLHYRPHTSMSRIWWAKHQATVERLSAIYNRVAEQHMSPDERAAREYVKAHYG